MADPKARKTPNHVVKKDIIFVKKGLPMKRQNPLTRNNPSKYTDVYLTQTESLGVRERYESLVGFYDSRLRETRNRQ